MPKMAKLKALILALYLASQDLEDDDLEGSPDVRRRARRRRRLKKVGDKLVDAPQLTLIQGGKAALDGEDT